MTEIEAERRVFQKLERLITGKRLDLFVVAAPDGATVLQAVVDGKPIRHDGSLTLGLAKLLNVLEE